jgi:acylphosphatase
VEITVQGYVQGVGFRMYVQQTARAHGIAGQVWNESDGSVKVVAQHADPSELKRFGELMWHGPGRVDQVQVSEQASTKDYKDFQIVHRPSHY